MNMLVMCYLRIDSACRKERYRIIHDFSKPETVGKQRTFLGKTGYFYQFIYIYAQVVGHLHARNKFGKASHWN